MAAKLFRYVLNFLRSQCMSLAIETDSRAKLKAILIEAEFFQVAYCIPPSFPPATPIPPPVLRCFPKI